MSMTSRRFLTLVSIVLVLITGLAGYAIAHMKHHHKNGHHGHTDLMVWLNATSNFTMSEDQPLTRDAFMAYRQDYLAKVDLNGDGILTPQEIIAFKQRMVTERIQKQMFRFDTNGDGILSVDEFARDDTLFDTLDTDTDGVLSYDEVRHMFHRKGKKNSESLIL